MITSCIYRIYLQEDYRQPEIAFFSFWIPLITDCVCIKNVRVQVD
jgi:hypothetical protein